MASEPSDDIAPSPPSSPLSIPSSQQEEEDHAREDILDVTPVQSMDDDHDNDDERNRHPNEHAFSSSSESGAAEPEDLQNDQTSMADIDEEEEEEEEEEDEDDSDDDSRAGPSASHILATSEWDKALRSGKPSTGAASNFFAAPSFSADSSDAINDETAFSTSRTLLRLSRSRDSHNNNNTNSRTPSLPSVPTNSGSLTGGSTATTTVGTATTTNTTTTLMRPHPADHSDLSAGVLPDVLMNVRQKIESLSLFDSDMMRLAADDCLDDPLLQESRASLKRSSQQSISAAVLVSLAHKRYERRRLAAMEIEKVVRSLVATFQQQQSNTNTNNATVVNSELERIRAILLLLSDDYVRSTSEDARKGGVVALAACAIGLKRASAQIPAVQECRDLILASVVHACQDHSQRVRYYATESLFNVVKVIPSLAVQHFFILFEILRSLFADVDPDVRSGADLLDKKLKEVIVTAMNVGNFQADACVPVFARFVYMRNKATKRLTLTWLQELNERLIGAPILEFLHLFLGGIFDMVADPTIAIRQSALAFLQSVLPKLLVVHEEVMEDDDSKVDFDKILQSLVSTMEHPDPFVRKVAVYWMSRIVKAHMSQTTTTANTTATTNSDNEFPLSRNSSPVSGVMEQEEATASTTTPRAAAAAAAEPEWTGAALSVRNAVPHVLPGILLSIGDSYQSLHAKDSFLPDQTTRALAEQTNACLQDAVRRDGGSYVQHLDSFIVALREELDSPGTKLVPAVERTPYRMDVAPDGTGIETAGWFRATESSSGEHNTTSGGEKTSMVMSRLCALDWVIVLYESVVPDLLKADYAREFVFAIIHQLSDCPPVTIVDKSLEVLAKITVPVPGEDFSRVKTTNPSLTSVPWIMSATTGPEESAQFPMNESNIVYALGILEPRRRILMSRDREVFCALVELHAANEQLMSDLSRLITYMCKLQPPEFVFVSFAVELDRFVRKRKEQSKKGPALVVDGVVVRRGPSTEPLAKDLGFVSSFVQHMAHVLLNSDEAQGMRKVLKDCIGSRASSDHDRQRTRLFHILLHSYAHNMAATLSLCLWAGAYRTASLFLKSIDPLDINLIFLLEIDRLVEMLERPLFRHIHIRMLERDTDPRAEGSGAMLFQLLKSLLMILPQSTCYRVLQARLMSVSRFRQVVVSPPKSRKLLSAETDVWVERVEQVRSLHCAARWQSIRADSLEVPRPPVGSQEEPHEVGSDRREWLGYATEEEERQAQERYRLVKARSGDSNGGGATVDEIGPDYDDLEALADEENKSKSFIPNEETPEEVQPGAEEDWKAYWEDAGPS